MKNILAAFFLVILAGCEKVEFNTKYAISPVVEGFDTVLLDREAYAGQVEAFLYYRDTLDMRRSVTGTSADVVFEKIVQGILYDAAGNVIVPDIKGVMDAEGVVGISPVKLEKFALMCVYNDPAYEMYGWRNAATKENLPQVSVGINFNLWQTAKAYNSGGWRVYYGNPAVPEEK